MTAIPGLLGGIVAALGILGFIAAGYGVLADRRTKDRLAGLRGDVDDLTKRNQRLEEDRDDKAETISAQAIEMAAMHAEIISLKEYRDAQAGPLLQIVELIRELHSLIQAHNTTAVDGFDKLAGHDALIEMKIAEALGLLGNRRVAADESVVREVHDAG